MASGLVCVRCGAALTPGDRVCGRCGQGIVAPEPPSPPPVPPRPSEPPRYSSWPPEPSGDGGGPPDPQNRPSDGSWRPHQSPGDASSGPTPPGDERAPWRPAGPGVVENGATVVEGQVRGAQVRSEYRGENQSEAIWTFRIEKYDNAGNRVLLVPVEMRGLTFEGSISDGDWVQARGRMRSGTLRVSRLENLTTGAHVRAKGVPKPVLIIAYVLMAAIAVWIGWGFFTLLTADTGPPPGFPDP